MKKNILWHIVFCLYGALMLWLLFDRSGADYGPSYWDQVRANLNLTPFHTISNFMDILLRQDYYLEKWGSASIYAGYARHCIINLAGNVVMFIPLGFLLPKISAKQRKFFKTLLTTAMIIILVELAQLFSLRGICDVDDLILNTLGAALGYVIFKIFVKK